MPLTCLDEANCTLDQDGVLGGVSTQTGNAFGFILAPVVTMSFPHWLISDLTVVIQLASLKRIDAQEVKEEKDNCSKERVKPGIWQSTFV